MARFKQSLKNAPKEITLHSDKQVRAYLTENRILMLGTGTQWGKTTIGALRMKDKVCKYWDRHNAFLVTAPTYKVLKQASIYEFEKRMYGYGRYNHKDDVYECRNGPLVYFRTGTYPDSVVGITNVRHVWCDEAGKYSLYFWENIQARADFLGCGIDLTTSPYALNWVYKDIIKPTLDGKRSDVELIQAASWENPFHSLCDTRTREEKRASMDERRFKALYGGEWGGMAGLVYDCFNELVHVVDPIVFPQGTRFYAGIDWGFTEPFALTVRALTPTGMHYQVSEYYKTGLGLSEIISICKAKQQLYGIQTFYCDPSQPGHIQELNKNGLSAVAALNDIRLGIDVHYELMKTGRFRFFRDANPHTLDELETYHYPEPKDLSIDDNAKETLPVQQHDHALDTVRYVSVMLVGLEKLNRVTLPTERKGSKTVKQLVAEVYKRKPLDWDEF